MFASSIRLKLTTSQPAEACLMARFAKLFADRGGATAIEYGLIAALIAVVIIGAVTAVGTHLSTTFTTVSGKIA
jgi:pilus assembly protein Flp/PilA